MEVEDVSSASEEEGESVSGISVSAEGTTDDSAPAGEIANNTDTGTGTGEGDRDGDGDGDGDGGGPATDVDDSYEEECVICLEELSSEDWGRCTPCNHAFHKKCWWDWENAHKERIDRQRQRGQRPVDEGAKCCLCNTVNKQFVDGTGNEPAHNPSPYVASEDAGDTGGSRFTNWASGFMDEAAGFMDFLQSEFRDQWGEAAPFIPRRGSSRNNNNSGQRGSFGGSSSGRSPNRGRSSSFVPPFFGSRRGSSRRSSSGSGSPNRTGVPPFFGSRAGPQRTAPSPFMNTSGNPFNQIRPGTQIITQHLVNSPHLNGQRGMIIQYQQQSGRYLVQLQSNISSFIAGDASPVAIRPENLLQTPKVKIHGLRSQPNLNGKEGTIAAYSRERNRYVVQVDYLLSPTREISIQPMNIRIPNGTCVRLEGLERAPHWNGKYGTIASWVQDANGIARYEVCLSRQYAVRVKMENVRL